MEAAWPISFFCTDVHKVLHTCMHIMCTCRNVSRAYLLWRLQVRKQNSLHGTHTVTLTWSHKHSCKAMEAAWPISFLTQTQSLTRMHMMCTCRNVSRAYLFHRGYMHACAKHIQDVDAIWVDAICAAMVLLPNGLPFAASKKRVEAAFCKCTADLLGLLLHN